MLNGLDPNRIPTGVLMDRMMLMTDPHLFAGQGTTFANYQDFQQQYWEFYNASLSSYSLATPAELRDRINQRVQQGTVPLLMLRYNYNEISATAFRDQLLTADSANGRVLDGPDRSRSPYTTNQFFSATLPAPATAGTLSIYVGPEYWLGNTPVPGTINIDFGDGQGMRAVAMGSTVQVQVGTGAAQSGGGREVKPAVGNDSPIQITVGTIQLIIPGGLTAAVKIRRINVASVPPDVALGVLASRTWPGYTPTDKGVHGPQGQATAIAWIKYAAGNPSSPRRLRRPLVFVEGIDFSKYRNGESYFTSILSPGTYTGLNHPISQTGPLPLSDFTAGVLYPTIFSD